jgi:hypothetical protein
MRVMQVTAEAFTNGFLDAMRGSALGVEGGDELNHDGHKVLALNAEQEPRTVLVEVREHRRLAFLRSR